MAGKTKGEIEIVVSKLQDLVKSRAILDYSEEDLSVLLGMTEKTIRGHLKSIRAKVGSRTIDSITQTFIDDLDVMMTDLRHYWKLARKAEDEKQILFYTNRMFKAWEQFADLLERFGIKPKAVERLDLTGKVETVSISINMDLSDVQGVQELESRRIIDV